MIGGIFQVGGVTQVGLDQLGRARGTLRQSRRDRLEPNPVAAKEDKLYAGLMERLGNGFPDTLGGTRDYSGLTMQGGHNPLIYET